MSWQQKLPHPIGYIRPKNGELTTLADARSYILVLKDRAGREYWQEAIRLLMAAAEGGDIDGAAHQLKVALLFDGALKL